MNGIKTVLLLGTLTGILVGIGHLMGGNEGAVMAFGISLVMNFFTYWFSDRIVLSMHGAHEVQPAEAPRLHASVDRLVAAAGIPKPRVYVMDDPSPNAFATGRNPSHSAVCVTTGIMRILSDDELEAVLAHELGHVKNRDILVATIAASLAGAVSMLATMLRWGALTGGYSSRDDDDRGGNPLGAIGLLLAMIVAPFVAMLVQLAVSRSREYGADETGAGLCQRPEDLASALAKISHVGEQVPLATATSGTAHLFISNPFGGVASWFSTHPPVEERIARLQAMAAQRSYSR